MALDPKTLPVIRMGSKGPAVEAAKMGINAWRKTLGKPPLNTLPLWGKFFEPFVWSFQKAKGIIPSGVIGVKTWTALMPYLNADARKLLAPTPPPLPPLIKPNQGFESLVSDLWRPYTDGRIAGLSDLGTYNPRSRLPSGRPSDHATSRLDGRIGQPACAFDLGFNSKTRAAASLFFTKMTVTPAVEYVIMENRIWSRGLGLHAYTHGGHETHVHTSGRRR